jgi:hypothetical protein
MRDDLPAFPADSRMRWRLLDVVLTITTLVACSAPPRDVRGGLYVFGHEVESLHLCNDTSAYWLLAPPSVSRLLRARHDSLTDKPYRPVFVEVRGQVSTKPTDGFARTTTAISRLTPCSLFALRGPMIAAWLSSRHNQASVAPHRGVGADGASLWISLPASSNAPTP